MTKPQFSTKEPSESLPTLVKSAAVAMRTGTDHEVLKAITLLYQYLPNEVIGELSDCIINSLPEDEKDTSGYLPVDPNKRLPDDETMQAIIQAMLKGDQGALKSIFVEDENQRYEDMMIILLGILARLNYPDATKASD